MIPKKCREFTYKGFRKKYGELSFKQRRYLIKSGIIVIFQQGYRGHSTHHPKKIRVLNFIQLKNYIKSQSPARAIEEPETQEAFALPEFNLKTKEVPLPPKKEEIKPTLKGITWSQYKAIAKTIRGDYQTIA
jgi:hypothetical protein